MIKVSDIMVSKNQYGAWVLTCITDDGQYHKQHYYFYTKGEAIRLFRENLASMGY